MLARLFNINQKNRAGNTYFLLAHELRSNTIKVNLHISFHLDNTQKATLQTPNDVKDASSIPGTLVKEGNGHDEQQVLEVDVPFVLSVTSLPTFCILNLIKKPGKLVNVTTKFVDVLL